MNKKSFFIFLALIILISIATRLLPHPPNFTPMAALALFAGVYATRYSKWFLLLPLAALAVSDYFIGTYHWQVMTAVYGTFALIGLSGLLVQKKKHAGTIGLAAIGGAFFFFFITNFAVWAFSGMYPLTFEGLMLSYSMALPFLKFTLAGDLFYVTLFFGAYKLAEAVALQKRESFVVE